MEGGIRPIDWNLAPVKPVEPLAPLPGTPLKGAVESATGFVDLLRQQLDEVVGLQNQAEQLQQALAAGQITDINAVVLAVQRADLALNFALELRNKVIDAYQELSRMQV